MTLGFPDPFEALVRLQRSLDMPRSDDRFGLSISGTGAFPPVNVFQKGDDIVVMAEMPGLDKTSLTIEVQKDHVRLAGQRPVDSASGQSYHRRERVAGEFDRTVSLPVAVDASRATATYEDGILSVTLPHTEDARPRAITVS